MSNSNYYDQIEDYLTGRLTPAQVHSFLKELASNEQLANQFKLQKLEHDSMELMLQKELNRKMAAWAEAPPPNPFLEGGNSKHKEEPRVFPLKRTRTWYFIRVAAVIGAIVLTIVLQKYLSNSQQPEETFVGKPKTTTEEDLPKVPESEETVSEENTLVKTTEEKEQEPEFTKPERKRKSTPKSTAVPTVDSYLAIALEVYDYPPLAIKMRSRTNTDEEKSTLELAAEAFDKGQFKEALGHLGQPVPDEQSSVRYLRGHILFSLRDYHAAEQEFSYIASNDFLPNYWEARWYLLLSYLAQMPDKIEAFEKLSAELATEDREEIEPLLKKIRELN